MGGSISPSPLKPLGKQNGTKVFDEAVLKFTNKEIEKAGKQKKSLFNFGYKSPEGVKEVAKNVLLKIGEHYETKPHRF